MPLHPSFLPWASKPDEQDVGLRPVDSFHEVGKFVFRHIPVLRPDDPNLRIAFLQTPLRKGVDVRAGAEEKYPVAPFGRAFADRRHEFRAGHPLAAPKSQVPGGPHDADAVGNEQPGVAQVRQQLRIAVRAHHLFRVDRNDRRALITPSQPVDNLQGLLHGDQVHRDAEHLNPPGCHVTTPPSGRPRRWRRPPAGPRRVAVGLSWPRAEETAHGDSRRS